MSEHNIAIVYTKVKMQTTNITTSRISSEKNLHSSNIGFMHSTRSESDHIYSYFCLHYFELKKNLRRCSKPLTDCLCMLKMYYYTWMVKVPSWLTNICPCVVPANINSWLPSLVQNTDGGGLPVASQSNLAMPFMPTLWSLGFTRKLGCAAKIGWEFFL